MTQMVNHEALMDRFGDQEFLHQLWLKARRELPARLSKVRPLVGSADNNCQEEFAKFLHKLRGLVSNFLTQNQAIPELAQCERLVENGEYGKLPAQWEQFEVSLKREVTELDSYLSQAGFETPALEL